MFVSTELHMLAVRNEGQLWDQIVHPSSSIFVAHLAVPLLDATTHHPPEQKCFIAISQAKTAGEAELLSIGPELDNI